MVLESFGRDLLAMVKLVIVYDSQTGNTEKMAKAIKEGVESVGNVEVAFGKVDESFLPQELESAAAVILGSPTHYGDVTLKMRAFIEAYGKSLRGKVGAAFGSWGWTGEAVDILNKTLKSYGMNVVEPGIKALSTPDKTVLEECRILGKTLAERTRKPP